MNDEAEKHLRELFAKPEAGLTKKEITEYLSKGMEDFENTAKRQFGSSGTEDEEIIIKFAGEDFELEEIGVMFGGISLER